MYIHNVKSENHYVATIIQNVAQNKKKNIQNIASDIMNGDIMNGNVVDAPHINLFEHFLLNRAEKPTFCVRDGGTLISIEKVGNYFFFK